jgi:hypothetical protein
VIDGQQRLTTLQLLLAAASKVARDLDAEVDAQILQELITNSRLKASGDLVFKVWPTNANRRSFTAVVQAEDPGPSHVDDTSNLIDEAYSYFVVQIAGWVTSGQHARPVSELIALLRVTLCDLLKVVTITLEADDNAQIIFETLNARGTPLLALDLVKNASFHEASKDRVDLDRLYEEVWRPQLDDDYWRESRRQGRLFRPRADLFLMHWLTMKCRRVIPATELFVIFRKEILDGPDAPPAVEVITELCADAAVIRGFDSHARGSIEQLFFERLEQLDISTFHPLVLWLFRSGELSDERRRRALGIIESWLARRSLMRLTTQSYNTLVPPLIAKVADDPARADDVVLSELRRGTSTIDKWPSDEELVSFYERFDAYANVARPRLVMALAAIERSRYSSRVDIPDVPRKLSLEHVMPQKWQRAWPLPADLSADQEAAALERRRRSIHKLGNLTLTAGSLNSSLSNDAWTVKQKGLNRDSKLLMNVELIERFGEHFDEDSIDVRTTELSEAICRIWPGPDSAHWAK